MDEMQKACGREQEMKSLGTDSATATNKQQQSRNDYNQQRRHSNNYN